MRNRARLPDEPKYQSVQDKGLIKRKVGSYLSFESGDLQFKFNLIPEPDIRTYVHMLKQFRALGHVVLDLA